MLALSYTAMYIFHYLIKAFALGLENMATNFSPKFSSTQFNSSGIFWQKKHTIFRNGYVSNYFIEYDGDTYRKFLVTLNYSKIPLRLTLKIHIIEPIVEARAE